MSNKLIIGPEEYSFAKKVAKKYLKNDEDVADAVQDALIRAWRSYDTFKGDANFHTWLFRVVANSALMILRKHKSERLGVQKFLAEPQVLHYPSPEMMVYARQALQLAVEVLSTMTPTLRNVFISKFFEDLSDEEIADRRNCKYETAKTRVFRSRQAVQQVLRMA